VDSATLSACHHSIAATSLPPSLPHLVLQLAKRRGKHPLNSPRFAGRWRRKRSTIGGAKITIVIFFLSISNRTRNLNILLKNLFILNLYINIAEKLKINNKILWKKKDIHGNIYIYKWFYWNLKNLTKCRYKNNFVGSKCLYKNSNIIRNTAKKFNILAISFNLYNYFNSPTKLFLNLAKFLNTLANYSFCSYI